MKRRKRELKPHDLHRTLTELEKEDWGAPPFPSHLVTTCHALRYKPLNQFTAEDLRIMIGQNFSLDILVPIALELLETDPLEQGDHFEGDLLLNIMQMKAEFLRNNPAVVERIRKIYASCRSTLMEQSSAKKMFLKAEEHMREAAMQRGFP